MRIRLKERCFFLGSLYEAGQEIILPEGMKGPMRSVRKSADIVDVTTDPPIDANHKPGQFEDVPLYDVISETDDGSTHTDEQKAEADAEAERSVRTVPADAELAAAPPVEPVPAQLPGEVRTLTHVEERERRP